MKTAKEWGEEMLWDGEQDVDEQIVGIIEKAQTEARAQGRREGLEDASEICRKLRETHSNLDWNERAILSLAIAAVIELIKKPAGGG